MKVGIMGRGLGAVLAQAIVEEAAERLSKKGGEDIELVDLEAEIEKLSAEFCCLERDEPCHEPPSYDDEPRYPRPPRKLIMPKHCRSHRTGKRRR